MDKLSSFIDRLQERASSAPAEHQSHLMGQVAALRATSESQQEDFADFLRLSEEYAHKYLLDVSAKIQQHNSFSEKLEGRLEAAKELYREAAELQRLYESEVVANMKSFCATGKAPSCRLRRQNIDTLVLALRRPLPEDRALFSEVELVLTEIRRCYMELNKFWTEEIPRASEAVKMRRLDPMDVERWKSFHAHIKETIESWKVQSDFLFLCCALPTDKSVLFRLGTSHQELILKSYASAAAAAALHARLRYADSRFQFEILWIYRA